MTASKRRIGRGTDASTQRKSLNELASEMQTRRYKVESLLKDFALLLFGRQSEEAKFAGANILHLFYGDDIFLTIEVKPNSFTVVLGQNWKSNLRKTQSLNNENELEVFLLKLYDEWSKPKHGYKQKTPKKRR